MYDKKRLKRVELVEEFCRANQALAAKYDHITLGEQSIFLFIFFYYLVHGIFNSQFEILFLYIYMF